MQDVKLMSDARHSALVKAAEDCIGLMNCGVDPDAALLKVAQDTDMNDKEIELVSCAVNNSKQLAHLQTAEEKDKENPFPLTNGTKVIEMQNSPKDKGWTDSAKDRHDTADAVGITENLQKEVKKASVVDSYSVTGFHGDEIERPDHLQALRDGWNLPKIALAEYEDPNPYNATQLMRHQLSSCRMKIAEAQTNAAISLGLIAEEFRHCDAPRFEEFEKTALHAGVEPALLDVVYDNGLLAEFGEKRAIAGEKTAGTMFVSEKINTLVDMVKKAEAHVEEAVNYGTAAEMLMDKIAEAEKGISESLAKKAEDAAGGGKGGKSIGAGMFDIKPTFDISGIEDPGKFLLGTPTSELTSPESISGAFIPGASDSAVTAEVGNKTLQELNNVKARGSLDRIMQDPAIKGHAVPDVLEAYNRAVSVNPNFGEASLLAYIRQDLASRGNMPLELLTRASRGGGSHDKEDK